MRSQHTLEQTTAWEHFPHGADIGIRGWGASLSEAFAHTALALTAVVCDPEKVHPLETIRFEVSAPDPEILLVDFLNELIFEMATRQMLFSRFELNYEAPRLTVRASGERVDVRRHEPAVEVKGATYTALDVHQDHDGRWLAQCIVDV